MKKRKSKRSTPPRGRGGRFLPRKAAAIKRPRRTKHRRELQTAAGANLLAARRELLAACRSGDGSRIARARAEAERAGIAVVLVE